MYNSQNKYKLQLLVQSLHLISFTKIRRKLVKASTKYIYNSNQISFILVLCDLNKQLQFLFLLKFSLELYTIVLID